MVMLAKAEFESLSGYGSLFHHIGTLSLHPGVLALIVNRKPGLSLIHSIHNVLGEETKGFMEWVVLHGSYAGQDTVNVQQLIGYFPYVSNIACAAEAGRHKGDGGEGVKPLGFDIHGAALDRHLATLLRESPHSFADLLVERGEMYWRRSQNPDKDTIQTIIALGGERFKKYYLAVQPLTIEVQRDPFELLTRWQPAAK